MLAGDAITDPGGAASCPDRRLLRPPAPEPLAHMRLWDVLPRILRNPIEASSRALFEGISWRPPFPGAPAFLTDPAAVRAVMVDHADHFPHGHLWRRVMYPAWGTA